MNEAQARKNKSIEILKQKNIPFIEHLPEIEEEADSICRDVEEVAFRAISLCIVASKAEGLEQEIVNDIIEKYNILDKFTPEEKQFINDLEPSEITSIQFLWRYEAYWVLLWALGYVQKLNYPSQICDVPLAVSLLANKSLKEFIGEAKLRTQNEILDEADLIYRYHWAVVEAKIKKEKPPAELDDGVVYERHYTLNWLIGHDGVLEWDNTTTNT